jgi:hypothetical protein
VKGIVIGVLVFFGFLGIIALASGQPFLLTVSIVGIAISFSFAGFDG